MRLQHIGSFAAMDKGYGKATCAARNLAKKALVGLLPTAEAGYPLALMIDTGEIASPDKAGTIPFLSVIEGEGSFPSGESMRP